MTDTRPLFRPEAVEYHAKARTSHRTLDLKERRTVWLFRGLLVAIVAVVGLAFVIPTRTSVPGTGFVSEDGTEARLTVVDVRRIEAGQDVTLDVAGTTVTGHVVAVERDAQPPAVRVSLTRSAAPKTKATATVTVRTSVAKLLLGKD